MTATEPALTAAELREVADGVFAYVQPDGGWCVNNSGLVACDGTAVLVDTAATQARARRLWTEVTRVEPGGPSLIVNTHHHGDHVFGNCVFPGGTPIVAHEETRTEVAAAGLGLTRLWPDVDWGEISLRLPTLTFRDTITLHAGSLRLELIHVGPAHTTNDVVVWVPERRVLFCGDVLMSGATPFCLMGSIEGSLRAIDRLGALPAEIIVTGHGPVAGPELLAANESYLRWIQRVAADGAHAGLSPLDAARETELGEFANLLDAERLVGNLHRAYAEIEGRSLGAELDVLTGFQDMVAYHGGLPACHA